MLVRMIVHIFSGDVDPDTHVWLYRDIELPMPPFIGLEVVLPEGDGDAFGTIRRVNFGSDERTRIYTDPDMRPVTNRGLWPIRECSLYWEDLGFERL